MLCVMFGLKVGQQDPVALGNVFNLTVISKFNAAKLKISLPRPATTRSTSTPHRHSSSSGGSEAGSKGKGGGGGFWGNLIKLTV